MQEGPDRLVLGRSVLQGDRCHAEEVREIGNVGALSRLPGMDLPGKGHG